MTGSVTDTRNYTMAEFIAITGKSFFKLRRDIDRGVLGAVKHGGRYVITQEAAERYIRERVNVHVELPTAS